MKAAGHAAPRLRGVDAGEAGPARRAEAPAGGGDARSDEGRARKVGLSPRLAQRLLEELIYERVRTQVDLLELTWFEQEIDQGIERILDDLEGGAGADGAGPDDALDEQLDGVAADTPPGALAGVLIDRADPGQRRVDGDARRRARRLVLDLRGLRVDRGGSPRAAARTRAAAPDRAGRSRAAEGAVKLFDVRPIAVDLTPRPGESREETGRRILEAAQHHCPECRAEFERTGRWPEPELSWTASIDPPLPTGAAATGPRPARERTGWFGTRTRRRPSRGRR